MSFLVKDWKQSWKWLSVQLAAIGATISGIVIAFPEAIIHTLALMPPHLVEELARYKFEIACVLFITAILARLLNQGKS